MALIPPFYLDCVVAIGLRDKEDVFVPTATGFLYGHFITKIDEQNNKYRVYLVTNRHVLNGLENAWVRCNPHSGEKAKEFLLELNDDNTFMHPRDDVDIAVVSVKFDVLRGYGIKAAYFTSDRNVATTRMMETMGLTEGDFVYVLGFPMGIVGDFKNTVIVRGGNIARIRDVFSDSADSYLIDTFIFPGNSGGPVLNKPEMFAIDGTKSQDTSYLIGVVHSYIPYTDIAISQQTNKPKVIFEENSGLAVVHPIDLVIETIELHLKKIEDRGLAY